MYRLAAHIRDHKILGVSSGGGGGGGGTVTGTGTATRFPVWNGAGTGLVDSWISQGPNSGFVTTIDTSGVSADQTIFLNDWDTANVFANNIVTGGQVSLDSVAVWNNSVTGAIKDYSWFGIDTTGKMIVLGDIALTGGSPGLKMYGGSSGKVATITIDGSGVTSKMTLAASGTGGRWEMSGNSTSEILTIIGSTGMIASKYNRVAITQPATGSTLTIADGKTLTQSNTLTYTGTDGSTVAFGAGGTVLYSGGIGSTVQAWDVDLDEIAAVANVRGDLLYTDSGPNWKRLAIGAANKVLASDGTDVSWSDTLAPTMSGAWTFSNAAGIALSASGGGIIQTSVANSGTNFGTKIQNSVSMTTSRRLFEVDWFTGSVYQEMFGLWSQAGSAKGMALSYDSTHTWTTTINSSGNVSSTATGAYNLAGTSYQLTASTGSIVLIAASGAVQITAPSVVMTDGAVISNTANTTGLKIGAAADKLGAYSVAPVIQPVGALQAAITNSTGGAQDGTLVDVTTAALADPAKINDNFTDIYALLNAMRTALVATGWMKGAA